MPLYQYRSEDTGEIVEVAESMADTPPIGTIVEIGGRRLTKLPSSGVGGLERFAKPFVAYSQAKWHPDAKVYGKNGHPAFESKRDRQEFIERNNARVDRTGQGNKIQWQE